MPAFTQTVVELAVEGGLDVDALLDRFEQVRGYTAAMGYERVSAEAA